MENNNQTETTVNNQATPLDLAVGDFIDLGSNQFRVEKLVGEGSFGKVAVWKNIYTHNRIAVKIPKKKSVQYAERELKMLEALRVLDPEAAHVVRFHYCCDVKGFPCLAFEMLDKSLQDLVRQRGPMDAREIRPIAEQMLVALDALKGLGILHTDIKPDNIMVVDAKESQLRVKLIDFGLAIHVSQTRQGMLGQPKGYRAPEMTLGMPFAEPIDVWGLGCVLAYLYQGNHLFPTDCEFHALKCIVELLGQPRDEQLWTGRFTSDFFTKNDLGVGSQLRLRTENELRNVFRLRLKWRDHILPSSLDALINIHPPTGNQEERRALIDLLKELLNVDGSRRITPHQALRHRFFSRPDRSSSTDRSDLSQDFQGASNKRRHFFKTAWCTCASSLDSPDLSLGLRDLFKTPCSPAEVSVASQDLSTGSGDSSETSSSSSAASVDKPDVASGVGHSFETRSSPSEGSTDSLDLASGRAESGRSDSAASRVLEDDARSLGLLEMSSCEQQLPSRAPSGRFRKALKRVRGFFKGVRKMLCCCIQASSG